MFYKKKKLKGSMTVEAAMIFPLILFAMFGIVYLSIVHYQNTVMQVEALRAMNRAGAYWQYLDMDKNGKKADGLPTAFDSSLEAKDLISSEMIEKRNPYRSIIDLIVDGVDKLTNGIGTKRQNATQYINKKMEGSRLEHHNISDDININNVEKAGFIFFGDDLKIDISRNYKSPLAIFEKKVLNQDNTGKEKNTEPYMNKKILVSGVISNQVEFIRNVDSVYDIGASLYDMIKAKFND